MSRTSRVVVGCVFACAGWVACGGNNTSNGFALDGGTSEDASMRPFDGSLIDDDSPSDASGLIGDGGNSACPSSCATLSANCGAVTDTHCGGVVMCGNCPKGQTCGGAGKHNVCGAGNGPDACAPKACADQKVTCGAAGDGCGGTLQCGSCVSPQTCGGDPTKPGQCGCTGLCAQVPACDGGGTTTLTGSVYDPAGVHPLYNVLVYVPNDPNDPGLQPFPPGITCDVCGATAAGDPLVTAYTAPDGTFSLQGVPVGSSIPLVIQLGHWRRQFTVNVGNACTTNAAPTMFTMPKTHAAGDIPRIAMLTGAFDPVECTLRKMGIDDSEFTDPGVGGHVNFFQAIGTGAGSGQGGGAIIDDATPQQASLFGTSAGADGGTVPTIDQYDIVVLECEGYPQTEDTSDLTAIINYANSGGRVFASDFAWSWFKGNGTFDQAASWSGAQNGGVTAAPVTIDLLNNPKGTSFDQWLQNVGVSAAGSDTIASISPAFHNTNGVVAPTQQWLWYYDSYTSTVASMQFTFNTPVGATSMNQCGRATYSDWHAWQPGTGGATWPTGAQFPKECDTATTPLTPQQTILEFMLFDLSACVQPYTPICTPKTCSQLGVQCGPAGDGCGNALQCGTCATGQTCGGGGAGKCGTSTTCTPETCASQGIDCGPAGDGCGHQLNCGNCPTGGVCGAAGPGKCGTVQ